MKVFYYTLGCKVNQYETENIKQEFEGLGFNTAVSIKEADICIINTCTVTAQADLKCRQIIHKVRKQNPNAVLAVTGCMAQTLERENSVISDCDVVTGASNKTELPSLVMKYLEEKSPIYAVSAHSPKEKIEPMKLQGSIQKTRATIKIQDGCNRFCSYCIIPFARGPLRSKPLDELADEAAELVAGGHKEIVLAGINLSLYGFDLSNSSRKISLCDAVETVAQKSGAIRIRLSSLEPELITDDEIERLSRIKALCPHFHLSLQSGCTATLKRMNRHYTADEYYTLVQKLKAAFPDLAITTDIMVGFPGETQEEFEESMEFVKKVGFARCHIFPYSERAGTKAIHFSNKVLQNEKAKRASLMENAALSSQSEFLKLMVEKTVKVLFERENCTEFHHGYSENYTLIKIPRENAEKSLRKEIFYVRIKEVVQDFCIGEIVD